MLNKIWNDHLLEDAYSEFSALNEKLTLTIKQYNERMTELTNRYNRETFIEMLENQKTEA